MSALGDRTLGPIRALIKQITKRVDYYALYSAVVNVDNGTTLDLSPEDTRFGSMQGIPKFYGVPGFTCSLAAGTKVLFTHQNGDPSRPCVVNYDSTTPTQVKLDATSVLLGSGAQQVVRIGDSITGLTSATGGAVTGSIATISTTKVKA